MEPRRYTAMHFRFAVRGDGADEANTRRAIELSLEKYCSVVASLAPDIRVTYDVALQQLARVRARPRGRSGRGAACTGATPRGHRGRGRCDRRGGAALVLRWGDRRGAAAGRAGALRLERGGRKLRRGRGGAAGGERAVRARARRPQGGEPVRGVRHRVRWCHVPARRGLSDGAGGSRVSAGPNGGLVRRAGLRGWGPARSGATLATAAVFVAMKQGAPDRSALIVARCDAQALAPTVALRPTTGRQ